MGMGHADRYGNKGLKAHAWWPFVKYGSLALLSVVTVSVVIWVWNK